MKTQKTSSKPAGPKSKTKTSEARVAREDAVKGLKMTIVDAFDSFERMESILGTGPARQLAVLRELIERRK